MARNNRSNSSQRWMTEHFNDTYVKKAQEQGYRSRSVFKLIEVNEKDHILKQGMTVIDLGAAPGGWSQYATKIIGNLGEIIALDILPINSIEGVSIIHGDFTEQQTLDLLIEKLGPKKANLVLSDMAPNISGIKAVDQAKSMYLAELALDLAQNVLVSNGDFLVKLFQGTGFDEYVRQIRGLFKAIIIRKPLASRARSKETYLLAKGFITH